MATSTSQLNQSSPENVIKASKGSVFTRVGDKFYLTVGGTTTKYETTKKAFALQYNNEIWYTTLNEETITFATSGETWIKKGSGDNKIGWTQLSATANKLTRKSILPVFGSTLGAWAGYESSYILNTSNELWSTGYNDDGQLGIGYDNNRESASLSLTNVKLAASNCEGYFAGAVKNDNTLWFTGYGGDGTFGNGANDNYDTWTQTVLEGDITGSGAISNLVTGQYYSALLMEDGTLWVSTSAGFDLGETTFTQITSSIKAISGGSYHLLFIKNDNTLWGIGDNDSYQLGNELESYFNWYDPYQIASDIASCAAMGYHSAYIDTDGKLFTFGSNSYGQLGTSYGYDGYVSEPQLIDTNVKFVGGGSLFTYYIKNDNTLYGMGNGNSGQLSDKYWNATIEPILIDTDVTYAVGGNEFGLYIKSDKTLYGMGYNYYWQMGNYAFPFAMYYTDQTGWTTEGTDKFIFTDDSDVDEIYWNDVIYANGKFIAGGGEGHTDIRYSTNGKNWSTGSITDVGMGISGIAYNGTDTYVAVSNVSDGYNDGRPEAFTSSDGITWTTGSLNNTNYDELNRVRYVNDKFIAVGAHRIVTSLNGTDWAEQTGSFDSYNTSVAYGNEKYVISTGWGYYNNYGSKNIFTQTFDNNTASYVSAGQEHVVILEDGTLYGVGRNSNGQLGKDSSLDTFIKFVPIVSNVRNVASGRDHVTFVKNDNTLWVMGDNSSGQLGDGTIDIDRYSPVQIDTNVSQSFVSSDSGDCTTYIKNDNTLWGMGYNSNGQLTGSALYSNVTESIQLDTNVVQAAVSDNHILYIKSNGNLYGIGYNSSGQLGTGDYDNRTSSYLIDTNVVSCAVSDDNSYYIKNDDTLYGMGYNGYGQLGLGDTSNRYTSSLITGSVKQVSAANNNASFITNDGTLYSMGYNGDGQLGTGDYTDYNVPTISTTNVSKVSCGDDFTYIIKNDGTVWATGDNNYNVLGIANTADKVMYSTDATTWNTASVPDYWYNDVVFGNNKFVMPSNEDSFVISSTDAINWTSSYVTTSSQAELNKVIYDGTKFVACTYYSDDGYNIFTSTDAVSWTSSTTGYNQYWNALAHGDGKYVLLSDGSQSDINPKVKLNIG